MSAADPSLWDAQAAGFDDAPDQGLRDSSVRDAWRDLLLGALPPAPADLVDLGCGTGTLALRRVEVRSLREPTAPCPGARVAPPPLGAGCVAWCPEHTF